MAKNWTKEEWEAIRLKGVESERQDLLNIDKTRIRMGYHVRAKLGGASSVDVKVDPFNKHITLTPNGPYVIYGDHGEHVNQRDIGFMPDGYYAPVKGQPLTYEWYSNKRPDVATRKRLAQP